MKTSLLENHNKAAITYDNKGKTYLIWGKEGTRSPVTLSYNNTITGGVETGLVYYAGTSGDYAESTAGVGDINGDGLADFAVGVHTQDSGGTEAGAVYVVYGERTGYSASKNLES